MSLCLVHDLLQPCCECARASSPVGGPQPLHPIDQITFAPVDITRALDPSTDELMARPKIWMRAPRKPDAWLVPHLLDLKDARILGGQVEEKRATFDGTIAWSAELFCDDPLRGVADKHGVLHFPKALYTESL